MNNSIRNGIKARKETNRKKRRAAGVEKERLKKIYEAQKEKVQAEIYAEITKNEEKIEKEIFSDKRAARKKWIYLKKLRGKKIENRTLKLFDSDGKALEEEEENAKLEKAWRSIYRMQENSIRCGTQK